MCLLFVVLDFQAGGFFSKHEMTLEAIHPFINVISTAGRNLFLVSPSLARISNPCLFNIFAFQKISREQKIQIS